MKKTVNIFSFFIALFALSSCVEDAPMFVASPSEDGVSFLNVFASEYLLTEATEDNIAERFVWAEADFGTPVNVTYELQASTAADFAEFDVIGSTTETNFAVTVAQMLGYAEALGLDNDPNTTDADGNANNTGSVFFRLYAYVGSGDNAQTMTSDASIITITWIEEVADGSCESIWVVGAAAVDAGWGWATPVEFTCASDVFSTKINLTNDTFRFFLTNGDWGSGQNYPYYVAEGYTIDPLFEDALDGDNNFRFTGTPGVYTLTVDDVNKTITLESSQLYLVGAATPGGWGWDAPTVAIESSLGVYTTSFDVVVGETFRFFTTDGDWGSGRNYPYYVGEGYTIDADFEDALDGDNNFRYVGAGGTITVTINENDQTITAE